MKRPRPSDRVPDDPADLNYLFYRQQVERSRAETAGTQTAREAHETLAKRYEEQIEQLTSEDFNIRRDT